MNPESVNHPERRSPARSHSAIVAFAILAFASSCSSDGRNSLSTFGRWIAQDSNAFAKDVTGAPGWLANHSNTQLNEMGGSLSYIASATAQNAKTTSDNIFGAPAWVKRETQENLGYLKSGLTHGAGWVAEDGKRFVVDDIGGAPAYLAKHTKEQTADMASSLGWFFSVARDNAVNFWKNVSRTFELLLFL
jgi:hypothetical protein